MPIQWLNTRYITRFLFFCDTETLFRSCVDAVHLTLVELRLLGDRNYNYRPTVLNRRTIVVAKCLIKFLPREAMLSAVFAVVVCLCVCLSVTLRYCIKTAKRRITQTTPHDTPLILVFWCQRSWRNSNGITSYRGDKCRWGGLKLVTFDEKSAITR